jgi:hypothetical protein
VADRLFLRARNGGIRSKRRPENHLYLIAEAAGIGLRFQEGQNHFAFLSWPEFEHHSYGISRGKVQKRIFHCA